MSQTEVTATRYCCKTCGAESPTGIGYVVHGDDALPAPAAGCSGLHAAIVVSDTIKPRMRADGRMTGGDVVRLDGRPVYVGTFGECVRWAEAHVRGLAWVIGDARGTFVA
jgi:hypothetical protein